MNNVTLSLDPSGNFNEGKGTTGWCLANEGYIFKAGQVYSKDYPTQMEYWTAVIKLITDEVNEKHDNFRVVCEDYRLYASAAPAQINSNLETPQLIGAIKWYCFMMGVPITLQMASEVKERWSNDVLSKKGILGYDKSNGRYRIGKIYLGRHSLDAVRHCLHFTTFKTKTRPIEVDNERERQIQNVRNYQYNTYSSEKATKHYDRWAEEDITLLKYLNAAGLPNKSIAKTMGRSVLAVASKKTLLGLRKGEV